MSSYNNVFYYESKHSSKVSNNSNRKSKCSFQIFGQNKSGERKENNKSISTNQEVKDNPDRVKSYKNSNIALKSVSNVNYSKQKIRNSKTSKQELRSSNNTQ